MRSEKEIEEAIKDKKERLHLLNNPHHAKPCKLCGYAPALVMGGDEPWADIGGYKRNTLQTAIGILEWVLNSKTKKEE